MTQTIISTLTTTSPRLFGLKNILFSVTVFCLLEWRSLWLPVSYFSHLYFSSSVQKVVAHPQYIHLGIPKWHWRWSRINNRNLSLSRNKFVTKLRFVALQPTSKSDKSAQSGTFPYQNENYCKHGKINQLEIIPKCLLQCSFGRLCATMCNYVQVCVTLGNYVQLCATMCNYVQLCAAMCNYGHLRR